MIAVLGGMLGGTSSAADASTPAPTVAVSTSMSGHQLPVATMTGSWTVQRPGRAATLKVDGVHATGAVTTIHSTWISSMRRTRGLEFMCEGAFSTIAPGSPNNAIAISIDFRTRHSHWQPFGGAGFSHTSQPLDAGDQGIGSLLEFIKPVTVQWRVRVTATYDDTSRQTFSEQVKTT